MPEELDSILMKYTERFGEGFPTFQLFRGRSEEECSELVRLCLERGKDAYEMGLVTDDPDILY